MGFFRDLLTWWNGPPLGTRLMTARRGRRVGDDAFDNVYYESRDGTRRWVLYAGGNEASKVPADWHGWLHHTFAEPPTRDPLPRKPWELDHQPNMTGTPQAYRPRGSLATAGERPRVVGDYTAWSPVDAPDRD